MKKLFQNKYRVDTIKLSQYDYRNVGVYFVTFNVKNKEKILGVVKNDKIIFSDLGEICNQEIERTGELRKNVIIDAFIVMPDHIHVIVIIMDKITKNIEYQKNVSQSVESPRGATPHNKSHSHDIKQHPHNNKSHLPKLKHYTNKFGPQPPGSLAVIINQMKGSITRRINKIQPDIGFKRQSRYYERIIRSERELNNVRRYIENNPKNWKK